MQLVFAIVQDEDADLLCKRLNAAGFELTRLNTVGGFLARGNVTVLTGVEDHQVEAVLDVIRKTCHTRKRFINPMPAGAEPAHHALAAPAYPLEVQVGGATVFCFPIARFVRLGGAVGRSTPADVRVERQPDRGANAMNLVLSIVQNEDADVVTRALLTAGYRVTRMNTAGGFLRRGNVTLLVGVEEAQVDDVLRIIGANCRAQTEAGPSGSTAYAATAFVLEASAVRPRITPTPLTTTHEAGGRPAGDRLWSGQFAPESRSAPLGCCTRQARTLSTSSVITVSGATNMSITEPNSGSASCPVASRIR